VLRTVRKNRLGFTLVEVMVAILILFVSMMAILYALSMSVEHNLNNIMFDEAVKISDRTMNELRAAAFGSLATGNNTVARRFRGFSITFNVNWTVQNLSANSRAIQVIVGWTWKGRNHRHSATSIVSSQV
jgi:prepilin-type N-terminal cleavage/methylation domain-containing protein